MPDSQTTPPLITPNDDEYDVQQKILSCITEVRKDHDWTHQSYNHGKMIAIIREMFSWKKQ